MCSIGQHKLGILENTVHEPTLSLEDYKTIIDKVSDYLLKIVLYDEGEPLLHPNIPEMIAHAASKNIATVISTNLAMELSDDRLKDLLNSGLSHLIIAFDGFTQEIYSKYRIGGELSVVKDNLERLMSMKGNKPLVELQFIRFGYNNFQFEDVRKYSESLGIERFPSFDSIWHPDLKEKRDKSIWQKPDKRRKLGCFDIYSVLDVDSGGFLFPCDHGEDFDFSKLGSLIDDDLNDLWNSSPIVDLRKSFTRGKLPNETCMNCHLENYLPWFLR